MRINQLAAESDPFEPPTKPLLHTIRPLRTANDGNIEECDYESADYFGLYSYDPLNGELWHIVDRPSHHDAVIYANGNNLALEHLCEACGDRDQSQLTRLACFGGASGEAYACPKDYIDHLQHGGIDGEGKEPCQTCQIDALLLLLAHVYTDAEMALDDRWDRSDDGFSDQQMMIDTTIGQTGLTLPLERVPEHITEDEDEGESN